MSLLISDANIFIDFEEGGILKVLFELSDAIGVPNILFEDELRDQHAHLLDLGLRLVELEQATVRRLTNLTAKYRGVSRLDMAALAAAEQETCPLVTGDQRLRQAAVAEGVEVHGTLWLAEAMVREKRLTVARLKAAYDAMKAAGRRLPWDMVRKQLEHLHGEDWVAMSRRGQDIFVDRFLDWSRVEARLRRYRQIAATYSWDVLRSGADQPYGVRSLHGLEAGRLGDGGALRAVRRATRGRLQDLRLGEGADIARQ